MKRTRQVFREMVRERGLKLRLLPYERLLTMKNAPAEEVTVGRRAGTIATLCQPCEGERIAVVLRGNLDTWLPRIKSVARDGFYKHQDGTVADMADDELYRYDPLF